MSKPLTVKALRARAQAAVSPTAPPAPKTPATKPRRPKVVAPPTQALQTPTPAPEIPQGKDQVAINEAYELPYDPPSYHFEASADPHVELASRELCRRKLLPFIQRFRPKYTAGWVHEDICRRIERFVKQVEQGLSPRLLLMMPPRSGKSEISSRHTPAWILGQHPEWEIIAGSHTSSLSLSFSRYLRDVMRDSAYTAVFPDARLDPSSQSVENWNLTKGGGYLAAGVGTGITGRGAHVLLLDDLVKDIEAADSITIRDNTWEWYLSTAYTRLAPGGGVLGLMTWWHQDDWAGRIQEAMLADDGADKFEIIRYPAINEYGDEFILADESILEIPPTEPVPPGSRLTRRMGTAIHPQRYTTEMMLRIKHNLVGGGQKRVWDALYQQNPIPDEGNYFSKDMFRYYGSAPDRRELYIYQAWDFAISEGKESDYTVGMCIGVDHRDNVYVLDVRRFRSGDSFLIVDTILDFARDYDADALGFEDGQIWKAIESQFAKRCDERRHFPAYEVLKPLTDKMVRANPLRGRMQLGKVFFDKNARWFTEMYKELLYFPAGKHDDQCLIAGTLITLGDGSQRAIECIRVGDLVQTPVGPRHVVAAKMTSPSATVYEAAGLIGTANHPVFTQNRGWIGLANLSTSDILQFRVSTDQKELSCHAFTKKQLRTSTVLSSMASYIAAIRTRIVSIYSVITRALEDVVFCIVMCGHSTTGLSPKAGWSTTSTRTTLTTTLQTSNVCPEKSTQITDMQNSKRTAHHLSSLNTLRVFADKLHFGIAHLKASLGTNRTVKMLGIIAKRSILCASIVGLRLSPLWRTLSSAQDHVGTSTGIKHILNTTLPRMLDAKQPVFNITVADAHCYYANGVLVHNCDALSWCIRLTLSRLAPRQKDYTPKLKSWKDDLGRFMDTGGASHMCS